MANFATYNPGQIIVSVAGRVLTGFAEDAVVTVERETDSWTDVSGADGEVARFATNDRRGTITVQLMQTSQSNLFLSTLLGGDELTGGGTFPVVIKDNLGHDIHLAPIAWIRKAPRAVYRKGIEMREWVIRTNSLNMVVGGAA